MRRVSPLPYRRHRELLRSLGGASPFEYDRASGRDERAGPLTPLEYDLRILLVTVDLALERIDALERGIDIRGGKA